MPNPIASSPNPACYPASESSEPGACDPAVSSCAPAAPANPRSVDLQPVPITGDLAHRSLVSRFAAPFSPSKPSAPDCHVERAEAIQGCSATALTAATALTTAPSVVGALIPALATFEAALLCGGLIAKYLDCKEHGAALAEAQESCESSGGIALASPTGDHVVCLEIPE